MPVEEVTGYPSILGGRVKTLHPKVFGGILARRNHPSDQAEMQEFQIPYYDLVVVDLYPFEETVKAGGSADEIIEKIDIGGISLIRAAAKNYADTLIVSEKGDYPDLLNILTEGEAETTESIRKRFAAKAFAVTSHYDTLIHAYFEPADGSTFKYSSMTATSLRYGENPHQKGTFFGNLGEVFEKMSGKELSFNNLVDTEAAIHLISEFTEPTFAIIKHTNACGVASNDNILQAWHMALAADPVSAFGGVLIANRPITADVAAEIDRLFFEILIAPGFDERSLEILKAKKNRILLKLHDYKPAAGEFKSLLNGVLWQEKDLKKETEADLKVATSKQPSQAEVKDLLFAVKVVKHIKSNTIVLVKGGQMLAMGSGQTSRVDALQQAIHKAAHFGFDLNNAVMASDAFFPFPDCVEIAHKAGISAVIQPGGSIKDQLSIDYCNQNNMAMVMTGFRHFKH